MPNTLKPYTPNTTTLNPKLLSLKLQTPCETQGSRSETVSSHIVNPNLNP